jgi:hypothetical protein
MRSVLALRGANTDFFVYEVRKKEWRIRDLVWFLTLR